MKNLSALLEQKIRFYYYEGKKVFLKNNPGKLLITFNNRVKGDSLREILNKIDSKASIISFNRTFENFNLEGTFEYLLVDLDAEKFLNSQETITLDFENENIASISEVFEDNNGKNLLALTNQLFIKFKEGVEVSKLEKVFAELGVIKNELLTPDFFLLTLTDRNEIDALDVANSLSEHDIVEFSNPDFFRSVRTMALPNDPLLTDQWFVPQINLDWAWGFTTGQASDVIGIMDVGINTSHPDLAPNMSSSNYDPTGRPLGADDHGTKCAGIACAAGNNSIGIAGVAYNTSLAQIRIGYNPTTDPSYPNFHSTDSWIVNGFIYGKSNQVLTMSCSFGLGGPSASIDAAMRNYVFKMTPLEPEGSIIAAAGNDGVEGVAYPASYVVVVAVGASERYTRARAAFSNYGDKLLVLAPGRDIPTTTASGGYTLNFTGTSASTPLIAGIVGLMREQNYSLNWWNIMTYLQYGCDFEPATMGISTWAPDGNKYNGHGIINLKKIFRDHV